MRRACLAAAVTALLVAPAAVVAADQARLFGGGLDVVSTDTTRTAAGIRGREANRGTLKVTHERPVGVADGNAAAISVSLEGAGTAAQGLFLNAPDGTSGKLMNLRQRGVEVFTIKPDPANPGRVVVTVKGSVVEVP